MDKIQKCFCIQTNQNKKNLKISIHNDKILNIVQILNKTYKEKSFQDNKEEICNFIPQDVKIEEVNIYELVTCEDCSNRIRIYIDDNGNIYNFENG